MKTTHLIIWIALFSSITCFSQVPLPDSIITTFSYHPGVEKDKFLFENSSNYDVTNEVWRNDVISVILSVFRDSLIRSKEYIYPPNSGNANESWEYDKEKRITRRVLQRNNGVPYEETFEYVDTDSSEAITKRIFRFPDSIFSKYYDYNLFDNKHRVIYSVEESNGYDNRESYYRWNSLSYREDSIFINGVETHIWFDTTVTSENISIVTTERSDDTIVTHTRKITESIDNTGKYKKKSSTKTLVKWDNGEGNYGTIEFGNRNVYIVEYIETILDQDSVIVKYFESSKRSHPPSLWRDVLRFENIDLVKEEVFIYGINKELISIKERIFIDQNVETSISKYFYPKSTSVIDQKSEPVTNLISELNIRAQYLLLDGRYLYSVPKRQMYLIEIDKKGRRIVFFNH